MPVVRYPLSLSVEGHYIGMEIIWIVAAFACGLIMKPLGLPPLIGYLAAGLLLHVYGSQPTNILEVISHAGVLLLLFTVGLKLRLRQLLRMEVLAGSLIHLTLMSAIFVAILLQLTPLPPQPMLIIAVALSFSSTVVAAKVLEQRKELRAFHGRVAIGILIMQDLVAVGLLSVSGNHSPTLWALTIFALPLFKPVIHKLMDWSGHDELLTLYGLVLAIVIGGAGFEALGLSSELGALLLGIILSDHARSAELSRALWNIKDVFLVGFFLQIGMAGVPTLNSMLIVLGLVVLIPLKTLLYFAVLLLFRLRARTSFLAALSLATYSEFGLIIAQMSVNAQWIEKEWLVNIAFAVALSFLFTAPLNRVSHRLYLRFEKILCRFQTQRYHPDDEPIHLGTAQFLVVGMGRVGSGAYDYLSQRQQRCVGLDSDPGQVEKHIKRGRRVLYADAEDPGLWQNLHLEHVSVILLSMPDLDANISAVRLLRRIGFKGLITATGVYPEHVSAIIAAGADLAYNYFDEVGVGFAGHVWDHIHPQVEHAPAVTN